MAELDYNPMNRAKNNEKENPASYFRQYREQLGFTNQKTAKDYLGGKEITPGIDFDYIDQLNHRLAQIIQKINNIAHSSYRHHAIDSFCLSCIEEPYSKIKQSGLLPKLNNQGRRPEEVLFSWLRGYCISQRFTPVFSKIFRVDLHAISEIGDDDWKNPATFKRSPKADLAMHMEGKKIRIEVQSGFQGINDIKEHKVREARNIYKTLGESSICIHIDVFNGQVAFVPLDTIEENDVHFVTRQQMEGQSVFTIDQNYFKWRLMDPIPSRELLELSL